MIRPLLMALVALVLLAPASHGAARGSSVALEWDANPEPDVRRYIVAWWQAAGGWHETPVENTRIVLRNIPAGRTWFACRAVNDAGLMSDWCAPITLIVPPLRRPPTKPAGAAGESFVPPP